MEEFRFDFVNDLRDAPKPTENADEQRTVCPDQTARCMIWVRTGRIEPFFLLFAALKESTYVTLAVLLGISAHDIAKCTL